MRIAFVYAGGAARLVIRFVQAFSAPNSPLPPPLDKLDAIESTDRAARRARLRVRPHRRADGAGIFHGVGQPDFPRSERVWNRNPKAAAAPNIQAYVADP